ncbi:MAG: hypothetical protein U0414_07875 [Polyangiaceae bacterium]
MFAATLPVGWLLFVAGPGIVGVLPIVMAIGLSISAGFHDWAFPVPDCPHCGAYTEWAPRVDRDDAPISLAERRPRAKLAA